MQEGVIDHLGQLAVTVFHEMVGEFRHR